MVLKSPTYYMELVKEVDALPPQERLCRIPEVLRELAVSLAEDTSYGQRFRFTSYLKDMIPWINKMVRQQYLELFIVFIERVEVFARRLPRSDQKRGLLRYIGDTKWNGVKNTNEKAMNNSRCY
ncbi:hypothetical protein PHMEG_0006917 [Phytophthora megakarya]|uniref:Uncharacterized protein n=1 Tax=Phytophthora megakarya TaxID=4795 RepID=A0A225WNP4_9STRA|nr:hypothetical protein PHMEG_0006917 [Phytophthora megakarya]